MRALNLIAVVAIVDVLLLAPLLWASSFWADHEGLVSVLGPLHGIGFVILAGLCVWGAARRWWGWWYPVIVVVTFGPLGSLIGDWIIRRRLKAGT